MNRISNQTITRSVNINSLLDMVSLGDMFDNTFSEICRVRDMKTTPETEKFIHAKLDELADYVNAHKTDDTPVEEIKPIIVEWLDTQAAEVVSG
ncbi:MAG: hypothetical protein NTW33_00555 [Methanoregula sp.]|nr:hypothetical protein [Methanoregula sp.]